mgnify:FL=1
MVNLAKQARLELQILSFTNTLANLVVGKENGNVIVVMVKVKFNATIVADRANFDAVRVVEKVK